MVMNMKKIIFFSIAFLMILIISIQAEDTIKLEDLKSDELTSTGVSGEGITGTKTGDRITITGGNPSELKNKADITNANLQFGGSRSASNLVGVTMTGGILEGSSGSNGGTIGGYILPANTAFKMTEDGTLTITSTTNGNFNLDGKQMTLTGDGLIYLNGGLNGPDGTKINVGEGNINLEYKDGKLYSLILAKGGVVELPAELGGQTIQGIPITGLKIVVNRAAGSITDEMIASQTENKLVVDMTGTMPTFKMHFIPGTNSFKIKVPESEQYKTDQFDVQFLNNIETKGLTHLDIERKYVGLTTNVKTNYQAINLIDGKVKITDFQTDMGGKIENRGPGYWLFSQGWYVSANQLLKSLLSNI